MTDLFGKILDVHIENEVSQILSQGTLPAEPAIATDTLGEVIEKLIILHIRTWMLEDAIQEVHPDSKTADAQIGLIKRKLDTCFKVKRPKLVAAINALIDDSIRTGSSVREDSVKLYKGVQE